MSKTLFWYLLKDLLRIFFMASGTLAGIMSFGGLLRPLTENGLDMGQVGKMLTYLTPAMMTYSLPVAALFAATMVYGRLSADNELTACRSCGLSFFAITLPALVLGLVVALMSLLLLCFIVPAFSYKVEQVIYSNIAKVVHNQIVRNHQVKFGAGSDQISIFAQESQLLPPDPANPRVQQVRLIGPTIVNYEHGGRSPNAAKIPMDFLTARQAVMQVDTGAGRDENGTDTGEAQLTARLSGGLKFPRQFKGNVQAGVEDTTFGPIIIPSMIRENVKFMDVFRLWDLSQHPDKSQRVQTALHNYIRRDQQTTYLRTIGDQINSRSVLANAGAARPTCVLPAVSPEGYVYTLAADAASFDRKGELDLTVDDPTGRGVVFTEGRAGSVSLTAHAKEAFVQATPDAANKRMVVEVELHDVVLDTPGESPVERLTFSRPFSVEMPDAVRNLQSRSITQFAADPSLAKDDRDHLHREEVVVANAVNDELHSRASFAVSCLILVFVGLALGMMFRSGNFLSAFAASFVPALLCITLIVGGQQTANRVPQVVTAANNPLKLGVCIIWSGNAIVGAMATYLAARLHRT